MQIDTFIFHDLLSKLANYFCKLNHKLLFFFFEAKISTDKIFLGYFENVLQLKYSKTVKGRHAIVLIYM